MCFYFFHCFVETKEVRDQKFDEETNTVTIKVVCCSPKKVMDKLCSKGCGAIKLIETIDPPIPAAQKPKEPEKPKEQEKPKEPEKPKESEKPKEPETPKPAPAQADPSSHPVTVLQPPWYNGPNYYEWSQPNGYDERPIYDGYGGRPPPPPPPPLQYGGRPHYFSEEDPTCSIM